MCDCAASLSASRSNGSLGGGWPRERRVADDIDQQRSGLVAPADQFEEHAPLGLVLGTVDMRIMAASLFE